MGEAYISMVWRRCSLVYR